MDGKGKRQARKDTPAPIVSSRPTLPESIMMAQAVCMCLLSLPAHLPYTSCLCVKSETAAVLVVTQQGLPNHMQWENEDVSDPDVLKAVEEAIRVSTSVKRIEIDGEYLKWTNVATAILKGAAHNTVLRELELETPKDSPPPQDVVDYVRKANPKLRLVVRARGESASHDIT